MGNIDRKAALAAYRERKVQGGIYGVCCHATGENWVGHAGDVDAIANRLWFTLRQGGCLDRALQAAWNTHGAAAFELTILEVLDGDDPDYARATTMRDRLAHWRGHLSARVI